MAGERGTELVEAFNEALQEVCVHLFNVRVDVKEVLESTQPLIVCDGAVAVIGFSGKFSGRVLLDIPRIFLAALVPAIGGENPESPDEMLLAVGEFGNLVAGHALTRVNNLLAGDDVRPAPPSAFVGEGLTFFNFGVKGSHVTFATPYGDIVMNVVLKEEQ